MSDFDISDSKNKENSDKKNNRKLKRFRRLPISYIIPNLITLLALISGLTAIRMALESRFELAIGAILIAAILDVMDGLAARMLKSTSKFGAELDSLADFVNFGVAPAIILYVWSLNSLASIGWIAVLIFSMCSALRLARYNVAIEDDNIKGWQRQYFFFGVPSPAGALSVLLPIYLYKVGIVSIKEAPEVIIIYSILIAGLCISRLPTFSLKFLGNNIRQELVFLLLIAFAVLVAILVAYPWPTLSTLIIIYLIMIPISYLRYNKLEKHFAEKENKNDKAIKQDKQKLKSNNDKANHNSAHKNVKKKG